MNEYVFLPLFAFLISFFTSQAGVSGAFLILPFQMSVLGFTGPSVSSTNLLYNVVSIPSGVYGYIREKRFILPLTATVIAGTMPGVIVGALLRINYLPDPKSFKLFAGFVLLYLGLRLIIAGRNSDRLRKQGYGNSSRRSSNGFIVKIVEGNMKRVTYEFLGERFSYSVPVLLAASLVVGVVSGTYGVGGGAFVAPFLMSVLGLPAYTIAGSTLFATFLTSVFGVFYYSTLGYPPNLLYGILLGLGGMAGMYAGARVQRFMPERVIGVLLGILIILLSFRYILQYFT